MSILNNFRTNPKISESSQKIRKKTAKKNLKIKKKISSKRNATFDIRDEKINNKILKKKSRSKIKKFAPPRKKNIFFKKSAKKNDLSNSENNISSKNYLNEHNIKNVKFKSLNKQKPNNNPNINIINIKNVQIKKFIGKKSITEHSPKNRYNQNSYLKNNEKNIDFFEKIKTNNKLNDSELNSLEYQKALELDKRTFSQYYFSLLKKKQLILFSFCPAKDYNLFTIKICLFLTNFSLYLTMNCFFFSDETMHKIYIDNGAYRIIYQLPQIIYTSLISSFAIIILKQLALSENNFLKLKQEKSFIRLTAGSKTIKSLLKIKFLFFFIINSLFLIFFWYFISCFCAVFINTKIILFYDTIISFGLSLLYPFGYYLIPTFFRITALRTKKRDKICLYNTGRIFALI